MRLEKEKAVFLPQKPLACFLLSLMLAFLAWASPSYAQFDLSSLENAAAWGDADSQVKLGMKYYMGQDVKQDYQKAREWFEKAADQGHPDAQCFLGMIYAMGLGVRVDYQNAREWLEKAADQNNAEALGLLGSLYLEGLGVRQNLSLAKEYFARACAHGFQQGCAAYRELTP